jgi:hypothetical protein
MLFYKKLRADLISFGFASRFNKMQFTFFDATKLH